jgi:UDP-2,3-diacylglucosamine hydrolase
MRVVLLSDAHVDGPDDPVQARLLAFLTDLCADRLVLLGDVFHRWWEVGGRPFAAYDPVVEVLTALSARGLAVHLVTGNHDFAPAPTLEALPGFRRSGPVTLDLDGRRVHLAHGDATGHGAGVGMLHRILRGRTFDAVLQAAGPVVAWRILGALAGPSDRVRSPPDALVAAERARAESLVREGCDLVVTGHLHLPRLESVAGGILANPGSFRDAGRYLVLEDGAARLARS